jgi:Domain of unknown function DUF29
MGTLAKTLYETDFVEWAAATAELLRERRFDDVDWDHLIEEIVSLGQSDERAVRSQLRRMVMHLIKLRIQPGQAGASWRRSIVGSRNEIEDLMESSPSLRRHLEENLQKVYGRAIKQVLDETNLKSKAKELEIPEKCPYTLDELLEGDLDTLRPK